MALNKQVFKTRALSAVMFAAIMLAGLFWNAWSFFILFSVIHFGCWLEFLRLMEKIYQQQIHPYVKAGFMMMGYGMMLFFAGEQLHVSGYGIKENISFPFSLAGFILMGFGIFKTGRVNLKQMSASAFGLLYISLSWGMMIDLYGGIEEIHRGLFIDFTANFIPLVIIISIWINDTMAYIVGSFIGKRPLSKISPKKTWEGTIGGIILSIIVVSFLIPVIYDNAGGIAGMRLTWFLLFISAITAIAGTFGDLFESKLKRMAGVKDSGSMMPGHGGFLDRFDSMLIAVPCIWLLLPIIRILLFR